MVNSFTDVYVNVCACVCAEAKPFLLALMASLDEERTRVEKNVIPLLGKSSSIIWRVRTYSRVCDMRVSQDSACDLKRKRHTHKYMDKSARMHL